MDPRFWSKNLKPQNLKDLRTECQWCRKISPEAPSRCWSQKYVTWLTVGTIPPPPTPEKMAKTMPDFAFGDDVAHDVLFFWSSTRTQSRRTLRADLEAASSEGYEIQINTISVEPLDHKSMYFIMNNDLNIIHHHMGWLKLWCFFNQQKQMTKETSTASDSGVPDAVNVIGSRQNWLLHGENAKAKKSSKKFSHEESISSFHSKICCWSYWSYLSWWQPAVFFLNPVLSLFCGILLPGLRSLEAHEGHTKLLQLHEEAGWPTSWGWWQMVSSFFSTKISRLLKVSGKFPLKNV